MTTQPQPHQLIPSLPSPQPRQLPRWRFWLPLLFQLGLIAAVPTQAVYTHLNGRTVILQTIPVDPYDLLRGYSQTLRYTVSQVENLEQLPGWEQAAQLSQDVTNLPNGTRLYVILEAPPEESIQPWKTVAVSRERPSALPDNQIALQGKVNNGWLEYGLEQYYFPEDRRDEINWAISQAQAGTQPFLVEVKIDRLGRSVPVSLWVGDRHYRF